MDVDAIDARSAEQRAGLRAWLLDSYGGGDRRGALTESVRRFAAEYDTGESTAWQWLSGARPIPPWVRREMGRAEPAHTEPS